MPIIDIYIVIGLVGLGMLMIVQNYVYAHEKNYMFSYMITLNRKINNLNDKMNKLIEDNLLIINNVSVEEIIPSENV